jgi:hypothetical protein
MWIWPADVQGQRIVARKIFASEHLMSAMKAIAKSKDGLSNAEVDDAISDSSEWMTLWVLRQLLSVGFIDYKVDLFGGPGHYTLTELGKAVFTKVTGQAIASTQVKAAPATVAGPAAKTSSIPKPIAPIVPQTQKTTTSA